MNIRLATHDDVNSIYKVSLGCREVGCFHHGMIRTAIDHGELVVDADSFAFCHSRCRKDGVTIIHKIAVPEAHRNQGIGRAFIDRLPLPIQLKGPADSISSGFFGRLGFRVVAKEDPEKEGYKILLVWRLNTRSQPPMKDDTSGLSKLGSVGTQYTQEGPSANILETFPNQYPQRDYEVTYQTSEFSSLCPKTGQPDFAEISVTYIPDQKCIETKSLKLYLFAYRQEGSFMETITNRILEDLVTVCQPRRMEVHCWFSARGGIRTDVFARYQGV